MKKIIAGLVLVTASSVSSQVFAVAAGGNGGCGWGNALFAGQNGVATHVLAGITNAITGNNTFGMTTGTNGCETSGTLSYGGQSVVSAIMDEFSEDVARGEGDALNTVAVVYGVGEQDRDTFAAVMHENFSVLFPTHEAVDNARKVGPGIREKIIDPAQGQQFKICLGHGFRLYSDLLVAISPDHIRTSKVKYAVI